MTDRVHSLTVALSKDIRTDDVQPLVEAIGMMKGVLHVKPNVANSSDYVMRKRLRDELVYKLMASIDEFTGAKS